MTDYPNIEAIASGTISGRFGEWPRVRPEAKAILAELKRYAEALEWIAQEYGDMGAGMTASAALDGKRWAK